MVNKIQNNISGYDLSYLSLYKDNVSERGTHLVSGVIINESAKFYHI